jgi:hypothetical protein
VGLWLLATHTAVQAHQQKEAYITLLFNERSSLIEVSHRFSLHDVQHGLKSLLGIQEDLATNSVAQGQLVKYIEESFVLTDDSQNVLKFNLVGHEVDGKYFWVYQERPIPDTASVTVKDTALFETWPSQINYINIEKSAWVRSARLNKETPSKTISLID